MSKPTMLVVDDNPEHLELILSTLQQNGVPHDIVTAATGWRRSTICFARVFI